MTVNASFTHTFTATETKAAGNELTTPVSATHAKSATGTLSATSTPVASDIWSDERTLSAGADTIDLTALAETGFAAKDFTGLKVQFVRIIADPTNTDDLVFDEGAANGYALFGSGGNILLGPGDEAIFKHNETLEDIGSTNAEIDVSSSDVDAKYQIILVVG